MIITIPEKNYSLEEFYETVGNIMKYEGNGTYDCTKINVAENIQDSFFENYKLEAKKDAPEVSERDLRVNVAMLLAIRGPKVDEELKRNEVEIFDGFFTQE